ncbi:hypothetical protein POM88_021710 [Heracleum sosnowskyi]|uniref:Uncharacterized protein n=1 Tax=Heracleum sosnowskyi TaxID=360622 RepID=A0AAD8IDY7_9APIA|nr:hypothetical protein POM88_021710 [Heracleum sosnowskyi]
MMSKPTNPQLVMSKPTNPFCLDYKVWNYHGEKLERKQAQRSRKGPHVSNEEKPPILDKEAVEEVKARREIPEIKPGYIIQLKVETPENKRRVSTLKVIVIARRNAGLNTTIRLRRLITGIGVESLFPLTPMTQIPAV